MENRPSRNVQATSLLIFFRLSDRSRKLNIDFVVGLIKQQSVGCVRLRARYASSWLARLGCLSFALCGGEFGLTFAPDNTCRSARLFNPPDRFTNRIVRRRSARMPRSFPCLGPRDVNRQGIVGEDCEQFVLPALIVKFCLAS